MNLTRISCVCPHSPLKYKGKDRRYGKLPYVCLAREYLSIRVSEAYYYYRVESYSVDGDENVWAGESGEDDFTIPETSPWSVFYEPD